MKLIYLKLILTVSVLGCTAHMSPDDLRCSANVDTPGTTFPKGDIIIEAGSNLTIMCMLNLTHPHAVNRNASHLLFYNGTRPVSSDYITILNETTIELSMFNVQKSKSMFNCKLRTSNSDSKGVCLNTVMIDTKPQPVTDFRCISHNWSNLTCTWKNPQHYVRTNYELKFRLGGPGPSKKTYVTCPKKTATDESCFWDLATDPMYRRVDSEYLFYFHGSNQFGDWYKKDILFYHFQHVIPSPPINLRVQNKSTHSVTIAWQPQHPMELFPGGLSQKVEYKSMFDKVGVWKQVDTSALPAVAENFTLTIDNLDYAYTHYDIRVWMKSAKAKDGSQFWSLPSNITFKTLSMEPGYPPKTDIGSFQIEKGRQSKRNVYIYWQQVPEYHYNGANFTYHITLVEPFTTEEVSVQPNELTNTYAKFIDLEEDMRYVFKIYSVNAKGKSVSSEVVVPRKDQLLVDPTSFTKIAYEKQIYELSWIPSKSSQFLATNYTLFWCANDRDRPYQCSGFLNWTHIPANSIAQNITVPDDKIYQFAISINSASTSSGMVWSLCTVIHNRFSSRMNTVYIRNVGSSSIIVAWQLECSARVGVIKGFVVYYCPVFAISTECREEEQSMEILDPAATEFNVTGLHSYTTYKLSVAVITTDGPGEPSDNVFNTTHASAPSRAPEILNVEQITNTTASFTWRKPNATERNGNIVDYQICALARHLPPKCMHELERPGLEQSATITDLEAFTSYTLHIRAFTNAWSPNSSGFEFSTNIGNPGKMFKPRVEYVNASATYILWDPPRKPNGIVQGYLIKINYFNGKSQSIEARCFSNNVNGNCSVMVHLSQPLICDDHRPTVQISAYNSIMMGNSKQTKLYGEWSDSEYLQCTNYALGLLGTILLIMALLVPLMYYLGKKLYVTLKITSEQGVKLPPGLDIDTKDTKSQLTSQPWIHQTDYTDVKPPLPADEEYLIRPTRTPNRSESENESERVSLGSGDTQSSECHQTSTSEGSEVEVSSTASTPPMQAYITHNPKSNLDKSTAALLSKINITEQPAVKPSASNLSYVIIGANNSISSAPVNEELEDMYNALDVDEASLPRHFLSHLDEGMSHSSQQLLNKKLLSELRFPESRNYTKYGESCHVNFQPSSPPVLAEEPRGGAAPLKNLVISTKLNSPQTGTTTTCTTSSYQTLPLSSSFNTIKPVEQKVTSPSIPPVASAIVINKGSSGYVTVSSASVEPNQNCV